MWYLIYDYDFNLPVTEKPTVVAYAYNLVLVVVANHLTDAELYSCQAIRAMKSCLQFGEKHFK